MGGSVSRQFSTVTPCEALEETQRSACSHHGGLHRDSDSPTKHQKHYRNSGVAIGGTISGPLLVAEPSSPKKKHKVNDITNGNPEQNKDDDLDSSIISND